MTSVQRLLAALLLLLGVALLAVAGVTGTVALGALGGVMVGVPIGYATRSADERVP